MDFNVLSAECAPWVAPQTMAAIVKTESQFNPLAININAGAKLEHQPASKEEAVVTAKWLIANNYNIDLGLGQVNSANLAKTNLSIENAFDSCKNLAAAATILQWNYASASKKITGEQAALHAAISAYNTGSFTRGFNNGYVQKVLRADKDIGGGNSVYVQGTVNTSNVTNKAEVTGNITAGFVWGGAEQKSEIEQRLAQVTTVQQTQTEKGASQHTGNVEKAAEYKAVAAESNAKPNIMTASAGDQMHSTIAPHAGAAQDPVQAKLEHFYELPRNEQRAIVNHMTDIYVTHNPGVDREDAQAKVLHEILNPQRNQEPEYSHG